MKTPRSLWTPLDSPSCTLGKLKKPHAEPQCKVQSNEAGEQAIKENKDGKVELLEAQCKVFKLAEHFKLVPCQESL